MFLTDWKRLEEHSSFMAGVVSAFMESQDALHMDAGRYELSQGCYVNVDDCETRTNHLFEVHRSYVDVQLMVDGVEEIFVAPIENGTETVAYDEEKDAAFYSSDEYDVVPLEQGMALVLYPEDLHAPCNWSEKRTNRKLVFKIPVELV